MNKQRPVFRLWRHPGRHAMNLTSGRDHSGRSEALICNNSLIYLLSSAEFSRGHNSRVLFDYSSGVARLWSVGEHTESGTEVAYQSQRGPGTDPRWCHGAKPPEARYIQTACSCQMLSTCRFVAESDLHLPYHIPKKLFGSARIPRPNTAVVGWAGSAAIAGRSL